MPPPFFTRVTLRPDVNAADITSLLGKGGGLQHQHLGHKLIWRLFSDHPQRERDFLWREMNPSTYYVLSARAPAANHPALLMDPPIPFELALEPGDLLEYSLRANPVVRRRDAERERSVKHDVVMHALRAVPAQERGARRRAVIEEAGDAWLRHQGERAGFRQRTVCVEGYEQHRIRRGGGAPMSYSTLDFDGVLEVLDPAGFLSALARGFGGSKAFGCGLMLLRRHRGT